MYETDNIIVPLSEDKQSSRKTNLEKDSKLTINQIKDFLLVMRQNYDDNAKFEDALKVMHGRFSKLELNLIELEKIKNGTVY